MTVETLDIVKGSVPTDRHSSSRRAIIVGGGIGGLATACGLAHAGWSVTVLESAPALREVGAGIQLSANAFHALSAISARTEVSPYGTDALSVSLFDGVSGHRLLTIPKGTHHETRYGAPYRTFHRADLLTGLVDAATAAGVTIRTNARGRLGEFSDTSAKVIIDGDAPETVDAELVIGADGLHSTIRTQLFGPSRPRFTGQVAWRALIEPAAVADLIPTDRVSAWLHRGRHLVAYPLRQGQLINLIAVEERASWTDEGWSHRGDPEALRTVFSGFAKEATALLEAVDECFVWGLFDRPPLERWTHGPVALLGDACHPMLPFMAQGAGMALEDAAALKAALEATPEVPAALRSYEDERLPRTRAVSRRASRNGALFHLQHPALRFLRACAFTTAELITPLKHLPFDPLYGYKPLANPKISTPMVQAEQ